MRGPAKTAKRILIIVAAVLVAVAAVFAWYVNDYYRADDEAQAALAGGGRDGVEVRQLGDGAVAFVPRAAVAGLVFYPGAKVQPEAYAPLLRDCAERGVLCVLVKPLFNLAILSPDAAAGVPDQFPDVGVWFVGGHSMGGVAASSYAGRHQDDIAGLVFLASYPADDLSSFPGDALSVIGTNDRVLNHENYDAAADKLPADAVEIAIQGGNHAYFGNYGEQAGDGGASITRESQQQQTADAIAELARAA